MWVILTPEPVVAVPGVDMATGASFGFYGATKKENAVGGERNDFATKEADRIKHPEFESKKEERGGRNRTIPLNEDRGPSPLAKKRNPKMKVACTKDFFDLQIMSEFLTWMATATKCRATSNGAGSGTGELKDWVPFNDAEILQVHRHFLCKWPCAKTQNQLLVQADGSISSVWE